MSLDKSGQSRRNFLTGAAVTVGAVGLAGLVPAQAAAAPNVLRAPAARSATARRPIIRSDRQGFNRRWFAPNLKAVYVPTSTDQVANVVTEALSAHGKNVKVTSGRHCYEDFVYNDQTHAVIDMSALNQVGFDPDYNSYFVDAGCENWTVYRTMLNAFNKTLPAGSCYSVGAGGHITGGGYGLLSRLHGLTIDHVTAIDIVTWDARSSTAKMRHVSEKSSDATERDLFWALRGGGGVIIADHIAATFDERVFPGGLTYSGHPLACASIIGTLDAMKEEGIVENAAMIGEKVLGPGLAELQERHPVIGEVRGLGVFWGLDLVTDRATRAPLAPYGGKSYGPASPAMGELVAECKKRGLMPFINYNRMHVAPPCTVTETEAKEGLAILDEVYTVIDRHYVGQS